MSAPVPAPDIRSLLEAARWAPSSMNGQPWSFILAERDTDPEAHARIVSTLAPGNVAWARRAPLLIVVVARQTHSSGAPNRHAFYDAGLAVSQLVLQATSLGLAVHQMGGFSAAAAQQLLQIPDGHDPVVVLAAGYPADGDGLPPELLARERAPRQRRPATDFVYEGVWERPYNPNAASSVTEPRLP